MSIDFPEPPSVRYAAAPSVALKKMLGRCNELFHREFPQLVDGAMQRVDDTLYEFADKAHNDRVYFAHFEAQRRLRRERASLKRRFLRNLSDTILLFEDASSILDRGQDQAYGSEDLEILADKELEESLVRSNMVSKAESRYPEQLSALTGYFARLIGRPALRQRDMPIGPAAITDAFAAALRSIDHLELSTILVVYKIFDQQVMDRLDAYYTACVSFAVSQGFEAPAQRHKIVNREARDRRSTVSPPEKRGTLPAQSADGGATHSERVSASDGADFHEDRAPEPVGPAGSAPPDAACTFETLQQILAEARQAPPTAQGTATLKTADLVALLSNLSPETDAGFDDAALTPRALRDALGHRLYTGTDERKPRRMEPNDEDAMDLVFLLFEQLLVCPDIPDSLKVLVSRLQIPYVKVALLDRGLFDDPGHPARRLLNGIARASIGWNDTDLGQGGGLHAIVERIVTRVVTELDTDPRMFEALEQSLAEYVATERRRAEATERRVVHEAESRNARHDARRRAQTLLDAELQACSGAPAVVHSILEQGWLEAMAEAYRRSSGQGPAWRNGERVLRDLLWSVGPKHNADERRELLRRIPELLRDLRDHLSLAGTDQQLLTHWFKELRAIHIRALRGETATGASGRRKTSAHAATPTTHRDAELELPAYIANGLPIGCWLGILGDEGDMQRFKLAWSSGGDAGSLLFVDRSGRKAFELAGPELDALLEQGLATVIGTGEVPLVDRAMDAVRQSLSIH
jgi:hypothetical protein